MRIAFHAVGCLSVAHSILRSNFADLCTLDEGYYGTDTYFSFDLPYVLRHYGGPDQDGLHTVLVAVRGALWQCVPRDRESPCPGRHFTVGQAVCAAARRTCRYGRRLRARAQTHVPGEVGGRWRAVVFGTGGVREITHPASVYHALFVEDVNTSANIILFIVNYLNYQSK